MPTVVLPVPPTPGVSCGAQEKQGGLVGAEMPSPWAGAPEGAQSWNSGLVLAALRAAVAPLEPLGGLIQQDLM